MTREIYHFLERLSRTFFPPLGRGAGDQEKGEQAVPFLFFLNFLFALDLLEDVKEMRKDA